MMPAFIIVYKLHMCVSV